MSGAPSPSGDAGGSACAGSSPALPSPRSASRTLAGDAPALVPPTSFGLGEGDTAGDGVVEVRARVMKSGSGSHGAGSPPQRAGLAGAGVAVTGASGSPSARCVSPSMSSLGEELWPPSTN